jgi:hypothetical protein
MSKSSKSVRQYHLPDNLREITKTPKRFKSYHIEFFFKYSNRPIDTWLNTMVILVNQGVIKKLITNITPEVLEEIIKRPIFVV